MPLESQDSQMRRDAREELLAESTTAEKTLLHMLSPLEAKHDASTITQDEEVLRTALRANLTKIRGGAVQTLRLESSATQESRTPSGSQSETAIPEDVSELIELFSEGSALVLDK